MFVLNSNWVKIKEFDEHNHGITAIQLLEAIDKISSER